MPVVNVREMCVLVFECCMQVIMCVRLNAIPFIIMDMLVVFVMTVKQGSQNPTKSNRTQQPRPLLA
jgi:hypothetical protein